MFLKKSDRLALVDFNGDKITHSELVDIVSYYSKNLIKKQEEKSFNILMFENRCEWIYSFYAIWNNMNVPITLDALTNENELLYFLKDSGAKRIIVSNSSIEVAKKAIKMLGEEVEILNVDEFVIDREKLVKEESVLKHPEGDDIAIMLYTSGTTGNPKGVMLSFNNIEAQIESIRSLDITGENEQILAVLPYHHILPLMSGNLYFLYHKHQYSVVLIEKLASAAILKALDENDITILSLVPRVYSLFYNSIKNEINKSFVAKTIYAIAKKLKSKTFSKIVFKKVHNKFGGKLTRFISGGAKSDKEMIEFFDVLGFEYCEGYGLTETSPVISGSTPNHGKKIGTVGRVVDNCEVKLVDGELWVKGPIVMKGYFNKPDKTAEVMSEDGYFKTGDLASIDEEGYITILGRKNAMIVLSNGKNIDPENLEIKLCNYDVDKVIKEVAIIGVNDKLSALIVIDEEVAKKLQILNINAKIKDIVEIYNSKVHNYEKILDYKLTSEELPKTRIGKVRRFMIKELYLNNNKGEDKVVENEPQDKEYIVIKEFIKGIKGIDVSLNKNLELDYGFDSLDQIELLSFLERSFKIKIKEEEFKENLTLLKLYELVKERSNGFEQTDDQWKDIIKNAPSKEFKSSPLIPIFKALVYFGFKIYFRISIKGKEKIKNKPQIFISNHESFIDAPALNLLLSNEISKNTFSLAIDRYFKNPIMKFIANNSNVLLLDLEKNIKGTIEELASALKQGKNIFIFPEGTRTKDGEVLEFRKIFAILSKELNVPVTCLRIDGAYEAYSRDMLIPRPYKLTVSYVGEVNPEGKSYEEIVKESQEMYKK